MAPVRVLDLEALARETIGDGQRPDLFFVSDAGVIVTVTRSFKVAYAQWQALARRRPRVECALEARSYGVVCSCEPHEDAPNSPLACYDNSADFKGVE